MNLEIGKIYTGWYFQLGRKEVFCVSNKVHKTTTLLSDILKKLNIPDNLGTRAELKYYLMPANLEIKFCPAIAEFNTPDHYYYNIFGKNFSGFGSEDINDGKTIVINLEEDK